MSDIPAILAAVQDEMATVSSVRAAPDTPPEQWPSGGVYALAFPATGTFTEITNGRLQGEHTLHLLVGTPRTASWRTDYARVIGLGDLVAAALWGGGTLNGTVLEVLELPYTFGNLEWGGQQLIGWRFDLKVLSVSALS